jgi:PPM family protein phosphatase
VTQIGRTNRRHTVVVPGGADARISLGWAALSDTGYRRSVNEDSLLARSPIFAVADGMGGHTAGDFASTAVVTRLAEKVRADFVTETSLTNALRDAVGDMTRGVGQTDLGTGTTVTGIALTLVEGAPYWLVFNIGDSRVYSYRDGTLEQLTVDHSIVQELLDAGAITPEEAEDPVPDYFLFPIVAGSRLLVCSDGLTKELTEHGIRYFLGEGSSPLDAAQQLMDAALGNGGRDNVTVVVVDVLATPESGAHREGFPRRAARRH